MRGLLRSLVRPIVRRLRGESAGDQRNRAPRAQELAIVIMVNDEVHNQMRAIQLEIRDRFGDASGLAVPPHISLKQGFAASDVAAVVRYFDALVQDVEPFEIRLRGIASFDEWILFVDVVPDARLDTLRQRILRDLGERFAVRPGPFEGPEFHFHATLSYDLSKARLAEATRLFSGRRFEATFPMDTLGLVLRVGDGLTTLKQARVSKRASEGSGNAGAAA